MNRLPQAPENLIRVISNFFQFASQGAPPVSMTPVVNLLKVPLVSSIPVANLPPVSNDTSSKFDNGVNDAGGKYSEQYQTAYTLKVDGNENRGGPGRRQ
jgi:hypothetical protein